MGIDNSDGDKFKIINSWDFDSGAGTSELTIDPTTGFTGLEIDLPTNKLHINEGGATAVYSQWTNGVSGTTVSDGLIVGVDATGNSIINNQESTDL